MGGRRARSLLAEGRACARASARDGQPGERARQSGCAESQGRGAVPRDGARAAGCSQARRPPGPRERGHSEGGGSAPSALQGASAFQATCALGKALRLPPRPHGEAARHLPSPLSRPWVQELQRARWLPRLPEESKPKMNAGPPMARCAPLPTSSWFCHCRLRSEATLPTPEKGDASAPFPPPSDSGC